MKIIPGQRIQRCRKEWRTMEINMGVNESVSTAWSNIETELRRLNVCWIKTHGNEWVGENVNIIYTVWEEVHMVNNIRL